MGSFAGEDAFYYGSAAGCEARLRLAGRNYLNQLGYALVRALPLTFDERRLIANTSNYRFVTMKSVIICRMCFNNSGSVTPWRDFGYNINSNCFPAFCNS